MRNTSLMQKFWLSVGLSSLSALGTPWGVMVGLLGTTSATTLITTLSLTAPLQAAVLSGWEFNPTRQELEIIVPGGTTPQYSLVAEPARIIVDLPDTTLGTVPVQQTYGGAIRVIRVAQFEPGLTRIVLELAPGTVLAPGHVELRRVGEGTTSEGQPGDRWVVRPLLATDMPIATASPEPLPASSSDVASESGVAVAPSLPMNSTSPSVNSAANTSDGDELPPLEPGALEIPVQMPPEDAIASSTAESEIPESAPVGSEQDPLDQAENQAEANQTDPDDVGEGTPVAEGSSDLDSSDSDSLDSDSSDSGFSDSGSPDAISVSEAAPDVEQSAEVGGEVEAVDNGTPEALETPEVSESPAAINPEATPSEASAPMTSAPMTEASPESSVAIAPNPPSANPAPIVAPEGILPSLPSPGSPESNPAVVNVPPLDFAPEGTAPDAPPADTESGDTSSNEAASTDSPSDIAESQPAPSAIAPPPDAITVPPLTPPSEATVEPNSAPSQSAPPIVATAPPTTPTTSANPANRSIDFGQPLPSSSRHGSGASAEISMPPSSHSAESILLPSGTVLSLRYPGESPLELAEGQPRQEVMVLAEAVQDQAGNIILPEGTYVIGRFETKTEGSQFIAQAISVQGQTLFLNAQSAPISGNQSNNLLRNSALGVAAGAVLGGLTGIGLIPAIAAGVATSAATTYASPSNPAIIQPDQVVEVQLIEDLLQINPTGIGG